MPRVRPGLRGSGHQRVGGEDPDGDGDGDGEEHELTRRSLVDGGGDRSARTNFDEAELLGREAYEYPGLGHSLTGGLHIRDDWETDGRTAPATS